MTLEQLRIFIAVAERQHVTQAAAQLRLTQSAVSSAVSALESRHDIRLFDRVGRNIVLNQAGEVFLAEAKAVLARAAAAETALIDLNGLNRGRLSLCASQTIASYWLPRNLVAFNRAFPRVDIRMSIGNTAKVVKTVLDGAAELGLVEGEIDEPTLSKQVIGQDELIVVVKPDHPWAAREALEPDDLLSGSWVWREPGSGTRSVFEGALLERGVDLSALRVAMILPGNEAVLAAVEAGAGAAAVSASLAAASLRAGTLKRAPFNLASRPYYLLRHKERYRSRAGEAFLTLAQAN
jgi:DNA-binding transcriptional LysR family regulator